MAAKASTASASSRKRGSVRPGKTTGSRKKAGVLLKSKSKAVANVGRGRGILGPGTADIYGRLPVQQNAAGNYGGGYAGVHRGRPKGAKRRG